MKDLLFVVSRASLNTEPQWPTSDRTNLAPDQFRPCPRRQTANKFRVNSKRPLSGWPLLRRSPSRETQNPATSSSPRKKTLQPPESKRKIPAPDLQAISALYCTMGLYGDLFGTMPEKPNKAEPSGSWREGNFGVGFRVDHNTGGTMIVPCDLQSVMNAQAVIIPKCRRSNARCKPLLRMHYLRGHRPCFIALVRPAKWEGCLCSHKRDAEQDPLVLASRRGRSRGNHWKPLSRVFGLPRYGRFDKIGRSTTLSFFISSSANQPSDMSSIPIFRRKNEPPDKGIESDAGLVGT